MAMMVTHPVLRIALVIPAYLPATDYGGPVMKLRLLAKALAVLGMSPEIWTADYDVGRGRVPAGIRRVDDIPVRYFCRLTSYHWSPVVPTAALAGTRSAVHIAHCFGMRDGLTHFAAQGFRRRGTPYLVETLGMHAPVVRSLQRKRLYDRLVGAPYLQGAAGLIATSEREQALLGQVAKRVWLRYNPVEMGDPPASDGEMRRQMGALDGAPVVGWLGRISRSKGLDLLVQAVAQIEGLHLAIAGPDDGDGALPLLQRCIAESGMHARVHLMGALWGPDRDRFLASIDAFALPSLTENFGNAAAEAAAVGLPVVLSDQCGVAGLLGRLGAATMVPLDVRCLRDGLSAALARGRSETGAGTLAAALRSEVSPERIARRQLEIYSEVLAAALE